MEYSLIQQRLSRFNKGIKNNHFIKMTVFLINPVSAVWYIISQLINLNSIIILTQLICTTFHAHQMKEI
jgi:hypothetical protein